MTSFINNNKEYVDFQQGEDKSEAPTTSESEDTGNGMGDGQ